MRCLVNSVMTLCAILGLAGSAFGVVPSHITVQGRLTDAGGNPVPPGFKSFTFKIFDASANGNEVWPLVANEEDHFINTDAAGLWTASVGKDNPLTESVFSDSVRWIEVKVFDGVNPAVTLPRIRLNTGSYSFRVATVDGASGGSITSKVVIGPGSSNTGTNAFAAGENNTASGNWSATPGGLNNVADDTGSVVAGGGYNRARGKFSTVGGGGGSNPIDSNLASGTQSTIGGGTRNTASAQSTFVGGGFKNTASGNSSFVGGGSQNTASGANTSVGGGLRNVASGNYATVGGGNKNLALGEFATIAGGGGSTGADSNLATGEGSALGGGSRNVASGRFSAVSGGLHNKARGSFAVVSGGGGPFPSDSNSASGFCAAVPGGNGNLANGNYSFAAGRRARADHGGTFVWGDSVDADFASTAANQFLIRAAGGVGIGTSAPDRPLHVQDGSAGTVTGNSNAVAVFERSSECWLHLLSPDANQSGVLFGSPANALMGSIRFNPPGDEKGYHFRCGNNQVRLELDSLGNLTADGCVVGSNIACPSDERLKENIQTLTGALDRVERLRGVKYEWRRQEHSDRELPEGEQIGLVAQEVRAVVPQAVIEQSDGYLAVDYARLVPLLIEAIKEQQRHIESLESELRQAIP